MDEHLAELRAKLVKTAQTVKETHEKIAATMDALAMNGDPEHTERRQALADQARINAETEATQIDAMLRGLDHEIVISQPQTD